MGPLYATQQRKVSPKSNRELRKAQDLTPAQLAELLGITQRQFASFEIGRRRIPAPTLPLLAKALGTSIE